MKPVKEKLGYKEKLIYILLIYINLNFIFRLLEKGIFIVNFNYVFTSFLFILGLLIYCFYVFILKKPIYKILSTLLIFSIGSALYISRAYSIRGILEDYFTRNISILNDLVYEGSITYFYQYKILLIVTIPLITMLILLITFRFMKKFIVIVTLGAVITLWFSNSYIVVKEYLFVYIFISSLTFIIMSHIKKIQKYREQGVKVSSKFRYVLIYGVIVSLLISKIILMLPQEYEGRDLTYLGNYFENRFAKEDAKNTPANKDKYSLASSGYSGNDKRLGGPINLSYLEVFNVKSDKPYYLKGNVLDFYDGNKWTKSNKNYFKKLSGKDMNVKFGEQEKMDIKKSLTIYPDKKFKTNTIFVPNYAFNVNDEYGTLLYDKTPVILSEKAVTKDYKVEFYEYKEKIDTIEAVRDYSKKILKIENNLSTDYVANLPMDYFLKPKSWDVNTVNNNKSLLQNKFSYKNQRDSKIVLEYEEYLKVPENISPRTYNLVREITKDADTSIDKVLKIKNYLTKNYVYDLQVSIIPKGSEFIDYFLFVEKKGYCTYFNTAMTVMCRIAGVPARYVEGFKTPEKKDDNGLYVVTNADAHAWCEVVLGAFEYSNMWTVADASAAASEDMQKKLKQLQLEQRNNGGTGIKAIHKSQNIIEDIEPSNGGTQSKLEVISDFKLRVINILTPIIIYIFIRIIKVLKNRRILLRSKNVASMYKYYVCRLAVIRIVKPEYQGDLEFAEEIKSPELKERMENLVNGSYEEIYGKHSVEVLRSAEYYKFLETYLQEYQGTIKYLLNKYLG